MEPPIAGVEPAVAAAVLGAALLHASWHALVKSSGDRVVALAGMNIVSGAVALVLVPFVRLPGAAAFAVIAVSVVLHWGYKVALSALYSRADLSRAYPLARGLTPVMALVLAFAFLGERPGTGTLAGVVAISAGISGLVLEGGAHRLPARALAAAGIAGATVAAYSMVDAYGVRLSGDWLGFTAWLVLCDSCLFAGYAAVTRGQAAFATWKAQWGRTLVSGALGVAAFGVFMWALGRAQVGAVAALRETSIVFSAVIAAMFLNERMTAIRTASVALVLAGASLIALFR